MRRCRPPRPGACSSVWRISLAPPAQSISHSSALVYVHSRPMRRHTHTARALRTHDVRRSRACHPVSGADDFTALDALDTLAASYSN